jgi:putative FmdB family regulatory protein
MPIYEYLCNACKNRFEKMQSMQTAQQKSLCPDCGALSSRVLSLFASVTKSPGGDRIPAEVMAGMGSNSGCNCGGNNCC